MNEDYAARLNRVIDYIDAHISEPPDLETLASVAAFSKYHFHRIFASMTGEGLGSYIQRIRLEKAAALLNSAGKRTITETAMALGFSSPAVFSRSFRDYYGMSPSEWRKGGWKRYGEGRCLQSRRYLPAERYREGTSCTAKLNEKGRRVWHAALRTERSSLDYRVEVRRLPERRAAYLRYTGAYAGDEKLFERLFGKLTAWAEPRGLIVPGVTEMLTIYHDSPEITEENRLRLSVCITVPESVEAEGEIGIMTLPAGSYAAGSFLIGMDQYGDAWNSFFAGWLPESGYQCADGPCYELYPEEPSAPEGSGDRHRIEIHIPVKPL